MRILFQKGGTAQYLYLPPSLLKSEKKLFSGLSRKPALWPFQKSLLHDHKYRCGRSVLQYLEIHVWMRNAS